MTEGDEMDVKIDKVDNGYVVEHGSRRIAATIEEVFDYLLLHFEGRSEQFSGELYGTVVVVRCHCGEMNRVERKTANGCSNCSPRLSKVA